MTRAPLRGATPKPGWWTRLALQTAPEARGRELRAAQDLARRRRRSMPASQSRPTSVGRPSERYCRARAIEATDETRKHHGPRQRARAGPGRCHGESPRSSPRWRSTWSGWPAPSEDRSGHNLRRAQTDRCEALGLARRKRQWTPARGAHRCAATPDRLGVDVGMLLRRARIDQRPDDSAGHRARRRADRGRRQPCLNRTRNNASDAPFID